MAQLPQMFDARQVDPTAFPLVQQADYHLRIIDSSIEATSDQTGGMIRLVLECLDGPSVGTRFNLNLNLFNKNPQACEIAKKEFSAICHVTGIFNIQDTAQLHGQVFLATVSNDGQYNRVKNIRDNAGNLPGKGTAPAALAPAATAPAPPMGWAPPAPAAPQPTAAQAWGQPPAAPVAPAQPAWQPPQATAPPAAASGWPAPAAQGPPAAAAPAWGAPQAQPSAAPPWAR